MYLENIFSSVCLLSNTSGWIFLPGDGPSVDGAHIVQFLMSLTIFSFVPW